MSSSRMADSVERKTQRQIRSLINSEKFEEVVDILQKTEKSRGLRPDELVLKARALQLGTGRRKNALKQAEAALLKATTIDERCAVAHLELAWFYYAVSNDPERAEPFFRRTLEICRDLNTEALVGLARCLEETRSVAAALKVLDTTDELVNQEKLREEKRALEG